MTKYMKGKTGIFVVFSIWMLIVLSGYYWIHKPIQLEHVLRIGSALFDLVCALLFLFCAAGIGRRILPASELSPLERIAVQSAIGVGVLSGLSFLGGIAGLFVPWIAWVSIGLILVITQRLWLCWIYEWSALRDFWQASGRVEKLIGISAVYLMLGWLIFALAPPIKWDALVYHLEIPRQYINAGKLIYLPDLPFWGYPQLVELNFSLLMLMNRAESATVFGWMIGGIAFLAISGSVYQNSFSRQGSDQPDSLNGGIFWVSLGILMSGLTIRAVSSWGYVDNFAILMGAGVMICIFQWLQEKKHNWIIWAAIFAGLAASVKWTSALIVLPVMLVVVISSEKWNEKLKILLQAVVVIAFVSLPWFAKNAWTTGNLFYPYSLIGNQFEPARSSFSHHTPTIVPWFEIITLPFSATFLGVESAGKFSADVGPFLLLLAAPGFFAYRNQVRVKLCGWVTLLMIGIMVVGMALYVYLQQTRLYFVFLPFLVNLAAQGWRWAKTMIIARIRLERLLGAAFLLVLGLAVLQDTVNQIQLRPYAAISGVTSQNEYLDGALGWYSYAMRKVSEEQIQGKILMLWEPRAFYAPPNVVADYWIDRWVYDLNKFKTSEGVLSAWRNEGYAHIIIYLPGMDFLRNQEEAGTEYSWEEFDRLILLLCKEKDLGGGYHLYNTCN